MNTRLLVRVRRAFPYTDVPRHITRHNRRAWVRSVRHLGGRWLLAAPMSRASMESCQTCATCS